jgi:hypothetical protein
MSAATDYVNYWIHQGVVAEQTGGARVGLTYTVVQHSSGQPYPGLTAYAQTNFSTVMRGAPVSGLPTPTIGLSFTYVSEYFSDRIGSSGGPFSGSHDVIDVALTTANLYGVTDGLLHIGITSRTWGGSQLHLLTANVDASTNQVLAVGPGVGNVGFNALHIISLFLGIAAPG